MPAPLVATYAPVVIVAAHTAFRDLIDSGSGAGAIRIRSATDALLAQVLLEDPCGTVNPSTGQLTLAISAAAATAGANGTAAYGEICNSDGTVYLALPAQAGTTPVSGQLVLNTLALVAGGAVQILSAVIG